MIPHRRQPTHPGVVLLEEFLKPLQLSAKQFAEKLGAPWTEQKITAVIEGKNGISDETARAFGQALGTSADFWNRLEKQHYQWHQLHRKAQ